MRPGPGDQMHGGRLVVGPQRGFEFVLAHWPPISASCRALTIQRGWDSAIARWPSGSSAASGASRSIQVSRSASEIRRSTALT